MGDAITYLITFMILAPLIAILWIGAVWLVVHGYVSVVDAVSRIRSEQ